MHLFTSCHLNVLFIFYSVLHYCYIYAYTYTYPYTVNREHTRNLSTDGEKSEQTVGIGVFMHEFIQLAVEDIWLYYWLLYVSLRDLTVLTYAMTKRHFILVAVMNLLMKLFTFDTQVNCWVTDDLLQDKWNVLLTVNDVVITLSVENYNSVSENVLRKGPCGVFL